MNNFDYNNIKDMSLSSLTDHLLSLNGTEFSILACIIGYALTINTTINEQASLGNFFELLGQFILTTSAQNYKVKSQNLPSIQDIESQIKNIYEILNSLNIN